MGKGIGSHQSAVMGKDEWLTPPEILFKLGSFDTDPCSPIERPWPVARIHYTVEDDGLSKDWFAGFGAIHLMDVRLLCGFQRWSNTIME